jgi:hypothetical protein
MIKAKMKGTAFLFVVLASSLLIVGPQMSIASNSDTAGILFKSPNRQNRLSTTSLLLIADRVDTQDRVIYTTDPEMERAMQEQERLEKEKEEKAWQMLQNMNIYTGGKKPRGSTQSDSTTQK